MHVILGKAMLKKRFSAVNKFFAYAMICALANSGVSQEFADLPPTVVNDSRTEEVQAAVENVSLELLEEEAGVETLTRGPLHEAFAEPVVSDPVPGLIVLREPPESINEKAPDFRPEGDEAIWIAGYWGWDEQREDFIWISGVYRIPPEGHRWVPGYWHTGSNGWQWVQGLWVEEVAETISYFPPPPLTLENGPSSPSPGSDYFYIPGNWSQSSTGYLWNVGYWHPMQDDLIWVPSHTVWTPRGCIFVNGYWDRRLPLRGLCFAPVVVPRTIYSRPGWYLRPSVVLNTQVVLHNLFVQPGYCHYLFGDYYGWPSTRRSVVPAYVYHQRRGSFDPLISFYTAYNARQGQNLIQWYGKQHTELRLNPSKRPPQHWSPTNSNIKDATNHSNTERSHIAHRLDQWNTIGEGPRITPTTASFKQDMLKRDADHKRLAHEREAVERKHKAIGSAETGGIVASTLALPKLEHPTRKNDIEPQTGKIPEQPRNTTTKQPSDFNTRRKDPKKVEPLPQAEFKPQESVSSLGGRRLDTIPNKLEHNREANPTIQSELHHQSSRARPVLPNERGGFELQKQPEQTRHESNRIANPLDTNRMVDRLRQTDTPKSFAPKIQAPPPNLQSANLQSQVPKSFTPPTQFRSLPNRESGSQGKMNGEIKNQPPKQQLMPPSTPLPRLQAIRPSKRSTPPPQPERQLRQGNRSSNGSGSSGMKDHGKKPK